MPRSWPSGTGCSVKSFGQGNSIGTLAVTSKDATPYVKNGAVPAEGGTILHPMKHASSWHCLKKWPFSFDFNSTWWTTVGESSVRKRNQLKPRATCDASRSFEVQTSP